MLLCSMAFIPAVLICSFRPVVNDNGNGGIHEVLAILNLCTPLVYAVSPKSNKIFEKKRTDTEFLADLEIHQILTPLE